MCNCKAQLNRNFADEKGTKVRRIIDGKRCKVPNIKSARRSAQRVRILEGRNQSNVVVASGKVVFARLFFCLTLYASTSTKPNLKICECKQQQTLRCEFPRRSVRFKTLQDPQLQLLSMKPRRLHIKCRLRAEKRL